jgi:hypothetical protein
MRMQAMESPLKLQGRACFKDNAYLQRMRTIGFILSVGFLLFIGGSGIQGFLGDWALVETRMQRAANFGQLAMAVTGLGAGFGAILKRSWTPKMAKGFVGAVAFTAGVAVMAWGGEGALTGLVSAGLGFLIGFVLYLGVRGVGAVDSAKDSSSAGADPDIPEPDPSGR